MTYCMMSCLLRWMFSRRLAFFTLKLSMAGVGLSIKAWTMPAGNEIIMSPVNRTLHLKCTHTTNMYRQKQLLILPAKVLERPHN